MINSPKQAPLTIGKRIRIAREKASFTQAQLAEQLGYDSSTAVSLIESDERLVKVETIEKIARILHQDVAYLVTGKQTAPNFKTALRADDNFEPEDVKHIESYIDYLLAQKKKDNGRGTSK